MRNIACCDCVVTTLLGPIGAVAEHHTMFDVLAEAGLTRPLRLVQGDGSGVALDREATG